jgi:tRNA threonylcarbamoyladenosine biosynthesis protein TsaB
LRTLVIDTATAACSVALIDDGGIVDAAHDVVGRGHAERLMPMIAALADRGRADRILVDCGPGSFTGVRVGLAAALGLGLGWQVPVAGYSSMAMIAAAAAASAGAPERFGVVLPGGHGEVFVQAFATPPLEIAGNLASVPPGAVDAVLGTVPLIGSGIRYLDDLAPARVLGDALPSARDALLLPVALANLPPRPIYGRAPDAKPMAVQ